MSGDERTYRVDCTLAPEQIRSALADLLIAAPADQVRPEGVCIDSREARPGDLFVCLRGAEQDGHEFAAEAVARGAAALMVDHPLASIDVPQWLVRDTLEGVQALAAWKRSRHPVRVVGITGSVGKTSTKELTAAVLGSRYDVLKSRASFNSETGLPLTLLGLRAGHTLAVLEIGMDAPGEIRRLCALAQPEFGVVLSVGSAHMEFLGSREAIADAKAELVECLPSSGVAVLNADDPYVALMAARTRAAVLTFGITSPADVQVEGLSSRGLDGISFRLRSNARQVEVRSPLLGAHMAYACAAAASVGMLLGVRLEAAAEVLAHATVPGRMRVVRLAGGGTLLDDAYNASPQSVTADLQLLRGLAGPRTAVLGDMLELGPEEVAGHRSVGMAAAACCDRVLAIGPRALDMAGAAREAGLRDVEWFPDTDAAQTAVLVAVQRGGHVLFKASRAMRLERLVAVAEGTACSAH